MSHGSEQLKDQDNGMSAGAMAGIALALLLFLGVMFWAFASGDRPKSDKAGIPFCEVTARPEGVYIILNCQSPNGLADRIAKFRKDNPNLRIVSMLFGRESATIIVTEPRP